MRGKLRTSVVGVELDRIIPAHAGQTRMSPSNSSRRTDHPRTCGANILPGATAGTACGSSPHMRGKQIMVAGARALVRIIPAHAGQTFRPSYGGGIRPDHPRTCGANQVRGHHRRRRGGSSPHMRGKRPLRILSTMRARIIPAHAGQTSPSTGPSHLAADHPRTCGANV